MISQVQKIKFFSKSIQNQDIILICLSIKLCFSRGLRLPNPAGLVNVSPLKNR